MVGPGRQGWYLNTSGTGGWTTGPVRIADLDWKRPGEQAIDADDDPDSLGRAGGLLLSPFPMDHGPFDHDDAERALGQPELCRRDRHAARGPRGGSA